MNPDEGPKQVALKWRLTVFECRQVTSRKRLRQLQQSQAKAYIDAHYAEFVKAAVAEAGKAKTPSEADKIAWEIAAKHTPMSAGELALGVSERYGLSEAEHDLVLFNLREFEKSSDFAPPAQH